MKAFFITGMICAFFGAACSGDTPTSPTTSTPTTTTVAEPTAFEDFSGTLPVGSSRFYSFTVEQNGTVNVTLTAVGGTNVPGTVWLGLGLGQPSGEGCVTSTVINTAAGSTPQMTGTYAPSVYCAKVSDIGNLAAPAQFAITIAHP